MSAHVGDDTGRVIGIIVAAIVIVVALFLKAVGITGKDPNRWYGKMNCERCGYSWESRRDTPPAQCPNCRSRFIATQLG